MIESMRWFGCKDKVSLDDIAQAGAEGVVTALHHIPNGEVWTKDAINAHKAMIEAKNLRWVAVESVPVHEDIKTQSGNWQHYLENYAQTLTNLGACGVKIVCYNFMPVIDWTRTDLAWELPNGATALRFDFTDFAVFDLFLLARKGAEAEYSPTEIAQAKSRFKAMNQAAKDKLVGNIIAGLPGAEESYTLDDLRAQLARYQNIDKARLRKHLGDFLHAVLPAAEKAGVRLAIHPDDPPRPLLGLPRICSTAEDMAAIRDMADTPANGFTFCTGSYGVRSDNALCNMAQTHADRIYFAHLRATKRDADDPKSFHEASLLEGDVDILGMVKIILAEEARRQGKDDIILRPDHGHQMLDDLRKDGINPGYTVIGRLKSLAELRGIVHALKKA